MDRTRRAERAISESQVVVGYTRYLALIKDLTSGKEILASGMRQEVERCEAAIQQALNGRVVSVVSSGDPGVYGMAGLILELLETQKISVPVTIVPGVTAASAAGARLGAPLMLDFACISLSDLLVPWPTIRERLKAVAQADLVVALYNPASSQRRQGLIEAAQIFRSFRPGATPVGVATGMGSEEECVRLSDLDHFLDLEISMKSVVIIGNQSSKRVGEWMVTPRGYRTRPR